MLASITPLGERARRSNWTMTASFYVAGSVLAGAALGAAMGLLGSVVFSGVTVGVRLAVVGAALAVGMAWELAGGAVPGPRRQVNERWLDEYRGWVYGLGYGAQLGLGLTTIVSSAATYAAFAAAFLAGPAGGAAIVGCFGAIRGLTPVAAAHVRTPGQLMAVHRGLERWRGPVRHATTVALAGLCAIALGGVVL
jgi:hypothetical protein